MAKNKYNMDDGSEDNFEVGHYYNGDFEIIKTFKKWEPAYEFYMNLFLEEIQKENFRTTLRIKDKIHKRYSWIDLKIRDEDY